MMKKLGQSIIFKTMIFLVTILLVAAILIAATVIIQINRNEYVPSTPFTRSTRLGEYLQNVTWTLTNLEDKLAGQWSGNQTLELKQLPTLAPTLEPASYKALINSNLTFLYVNETTGFSMTNSDLTTVPTDRTDLKTSLVNQLMSGKYAFHQDFKQGVIRMGGELTVDELPPQMNQSLLNMGLKENVQLTIQLDTSFSKADSLRSLSAQYSKEQSWTITALIVLVAAFVLLALAWIFLIRYAGWQKTNPTVHLSWIDRIFGEILLFVSAVLMAFIIMIVSRGSFDSIPVYLSLALVAYPIFGIVLLSLIRRFKAGILWQQTICWRVWHLVRRFYQNRSLFWKVMIGYLAFILLSFTAIMLAANGRSLLVLFALAALIALPTLFILLPAMSWSIQFQKVSQSAENMGFDVFQLDLPADELKPDLKKLAGTLASTHERMQLAIAEQMKSERLKTDLISNVSHDLKTPLTSIISYVDLLKQYADDPEKCASYLDVLEQKSQRLKILTENLFEAAKASSGSLPVQRSKVILNELIHQVAGEFSDRLSEHQLTLIMNEPVDEENNPVNLVLSSDGGHIWRILDNLMTNTCKYAMEGTRVYLDLKCDDSQAVIELKNISRACLNCSAEELQQRFVRGDQSRHTDGSGLGLAIATSLAELLHGKLTIQLDGDLFKAILTLPYE